MTPIVHTDFPTKDILLQKVFVLVYLFTRLRNLAVRNVPLPGYYYKLELTGTIFCYQYFISKKQNYKNV